MTKRDLVVASTRYHLARLLKYYPRRPCAPSLIKSRFFSHTTNLLTVLTFLHFEIPYMYTRGESLATLVSKSILKSLTQVDPVTRLTYLGFILDSSTMTISLPEEKIEKIISKCSQLHQSKIATIRRVAEISGLLVSAFPAVR